MSCLRHVHKHLRPERHLIIDIQNISVRNLLNGDFSTVYSKSFETQDGRKVTFGTRETSVDFSKQVTQGEMIYVIDHLDGTKERFVYPGQGRFFYRYEIEHLLERTGFRVEVLYEDFAKNPYGSFLDSIRYPGDIIAVAAKS